MYRKSIFLLVLVISSFLVLAGCANAPTYKDSCRSLLYQYHLMKKVESEGVQVVKVGDEVTLILPTKRFFYPHSNNLKSVGNALNNVILYINTFTTEDIQVKGYADSEQDYVRGLALSRAQAQAISNYLWTHGLNTRLISANGYGCHDPYGFDHVEIFFRVPPPDDVFH